MKLADLTVEEFETLMHKVIEEEVEDMYFAFDPSIKEKIEEGLKDIQDGNLTSLDDLVAARKASGGKI